MTAAVRLAAILGAPADLMDEALSLLVAEGYIAILPRQATLDVVAPVLVATTEKAGAYATACVAEINRLTGRKFKVTDEVVKQAKTLLRGKVPLEKALEAIRFKHAEWFKKPDMVQYVQPSTLLRLSNMKTYLAQMEAGPAKTRPTQPVFRQLGDG